MLNLNDAAITIVISMQLSISCRKQKVGILRLRFVFMKLLHFLLRVYRSLQYKIHGKKDSTGVRDLKFSQHVNTMYFILN